MAQDERVAVDRRFFVAPHDDSWSIGQWLRDFIEQAFRIAERETQDFDGIGFGAPDEDGVEHSFTYVLDDGDETELWGEYDVQSLSEWIDYLDTLPGESA